MHKVRPVHRGIPFLSPGIEGKKKRERERKRNREEKRRKFELRNKMRRKITLCCDLVLLGSVLSPPYSGDS